MRFELIKVLIVDDNQNMRTLLWEMLRAIGVKEVRAAADGAQALQVMRDYQVDIVFSDLKMKPVDGIDFVNLLRNSPDSPDPFASVIMVTGHSTRERVEAARDVGVNEFLTKPIQARHLLDRIQRIVERPRAFVKTDDYFGPDRRRRADPNYSGPRRRADDERLDIDAIG